MISFLQKVTIKNKIILIVLLTCSLIIGLGFTIIFINNVNNMKRDMVSSTSMNAKLIGEYCATALSFQYPDRAMEILEKLESLPEILNGNIYDVNGNLFASYNKTGEASVTLSPIKKKSHMFEEDHLHVWEPIVFMNKKHGTIYLRAFTSLSKKIRNHLVVTLSLIFGLLMLSYLIATMLQRIISGPILKLAEISGEISSKGDYSLRVKNRSQDEIGILYDEFNTMLNVIQNRDEELETKNAELERFTYTVSHDLKSPLITIKGFLGVLANDAANGDIDNMKKDISRISAAADKMQRLLEELLELSRIGRLINAPEEIPFKDLVDDAKESIAGRLLKKNVKLDVESNLPVIFGDRTRLREVLENLIDNAAKYMGDQSQPWIKIGVKPDIKNTVFYVKDNGIGIDLKYHDKVFSIFDKLNPSTEGTGVGLAIVKRIVEVHGGSIWVESEGDGKGTAFCFTVPDKKKEKIKEV